MARIRRKVRGRVVDADGTELFADVAVLELDGGLLFAGRAIDYPDAPELPRSRLRQVAEVSGARLAGAGRLRETYSDLDGNVFYVEKTAGRCDFGCSSPYRPIGSAIAVG